MKSVLKSEYARPRLVVYGKLEEITQANGDMNATDQAFPDNTPFKNLTFS
jgi:hypothetical protein